NEGGHTTPTFGKTALARCRSSSDLIPPRKRGPRGKRRALPPWTPAFAGNHWSLFTRRERDSRFHRVGIRARLSLLWGGGQPYDGSTCGALRNEARRPDAVADPGPRRGPFDSSRDDDRERADQPGTGDQPSVHRRGRAV